MLVKSKIIWEVLRSFGVFQSANGEGDCLGTSKGSMEGHGALELFYSAGIKQDFF